MLWAFRAERAIWGTPTIAGDTVYFGGAAFKDRVDKGGLYALTLVEGKFSRDERDRRLLVVKDTLEVEGNWSGVASSPVVADGVIYFGGLDGRLYAVGDEGVSH